MSQPFYHLRPNKYVDRRLFLNAIDRIGQLFDLKKHRYVGFGSYLFDDFKLFHDRLQIDNMISLESDIDNFKRAEYNVPYNCITVFNQSSTDFISNGEWGEYNNIIWLDYTSPRKLSQQFSDVASLSNLLLPHDILRVTLNANAGTLGDLGKNGEDVSIGLQKRMDKFKTRMGDYVVSDMREEDFKTDNYPILVLKCLRALICNSFIETKMDKRFFVPLFSTVYQDGEHRMLTFTGVVLDDHDEHARLEALMQDVSFVNMKWDEPSYIKIPELTVKEMLTINRMLPGEGAKEQINSELGFVFGNNLEEIESYISFYKYYPSFQSVSF